MSEVQVRFKLSPTLRVSNIDEDNIIFVGPTEKDKLDNYLMTKVVLIKLCYMKLLIIITFDIPYMLITEVTHIALCHLSM